MVQKVLDNNGCLMYFFLYDSSNKRLVISNDLVTNES